MSFTSKTVRLIKLTTASVFLVFLAILLLASVLLFSHWGNQALITIAQKVEPRFSMELEQGSLFNAPVYSQISWIDQQANIQIGSASYIFDWFCLFNKVCLKELNISDAKIIIAPQDPSEVDENSEKTAIGAFELPVAFDLQKIKLKKIHFALGELTVDLNELNLQAQAIHKEIRLKTALDGLLVTLPEGAATQAATTKSAGNKKLPTSLPALLSADQLPEISLPLNLYVEPLEIRNFTVKQGEGTLFELNALNSQFSFTGSKLAIQSFALNLPETDLQLNGDIDFIGHYPLNLSIKGQLKAIKQLQQAQLLSGQIYELKSAGDLSQLKTELLLSNKISMQLKSKVNLFKENLPYSLSLNWQKLRWPLTGDSQYSSENGSLQSSGDLSNYIIKLDGGYHIETIPPGSLALQAQGNLTQLNIKQLMVNTLDGSINLSGLLNWQDRIKWQGQLSVDKIDLAQLDTQYTGNFSGTIKQNLAVTLNAPKSPAWEFTIPELDINGVFLKRPFAVKGVISGDNKQGVSFKDLVVRNADNKLIVNGLLAQKNDLNVKLDIINLGHALLGSTGKINGEINIQGPNDAIQVKSNLQGQLLSYQTNTVNSFQLDGVATVLPKPKISLQLAADTLSIADNKIDKITLKIENVSSSESAEQHQILLSVKSELISSDLQFQFLQNNTQWLTTLSAASLYFGQQELSLNSPIDITVENENALLSPHCWISSNNKNDNSGKLCFKKLDIGKAGEVALDIDSYLLSSFDSFLPDEIRIAGALSANAQINWFETKKPVFDINIFSNDMSMSVNLKKTKKGNVVYPIDTFNIKLASNNKISDLSAEISSKNLIDAKINGQLFFYKNRPDVKAIAEIELPDFSPFAVLIPQLEKLAGQLQTKLTITGPLKHPLVNGLININNTEIIAVDTPVHIRRLNTAITLKDRSATVEGTFYTDQFSPIKKEEVTESNTLVSTAITLFDSSVKMAGKVIKKGKEIAHLDALPSNDDVSGIAHIEGGVDWNNKLTGNLHFFANKMTLYDYNHIDFLVSPDLYLTFDERVKIKGNIFVDKGKITVKELPEGAVSNSKDVIVVDIEVPENAATLPVEMDLKVDLGNRLKVKALGLDTTINGNLLIRKAIEKNITIHGELNLVDGSYRALGQQLVLQKSRINFQGVPDSPYISIEAIRDPNKIEDNVTAGVRVTGTPDELSLVIFSDPAMSQQDALSYLTRGKSLQASSDTQGNSQLAGLLIDLGAEQSSDVISDIGKTIGIKDLALSSSGSGDNQSVGVSGEIAPGIELSYGVGVFDSFTVLAIRYEMFARFYIEASSGLDQAIDAYYEFDWD
ncbi:MAG: translocation and assembly module TamB [Psychromonas sp.]|jgi:translocation and assembly module TamB|uniref:translocation/assembly module TamB domain-containing protein n=1 Tax=Psychromonas sp. TaxID=1884585 RepID=UPI0039E4C76E